MKDYSNSSRRSYGARLLMCLGVFTLLFLFPHLVAAQDTGYIGGTVIDKSGAAVVGAEVTLVNAGGALRRTHYHKRFGRLRHPGLPVIPTISAVRQGISEIHRHENRLERWRQRSHRRDPHHRCGHRRSHGHRREHRSSRNQLLRIELHHQW